MIKKYVFLTPSIVFMGGAEVYINNKVKRLLNNGFIPYVFSYKQGEIVLDSLKQYKQCINNMLRLPPILYRRRDVIETIIQLCDMVGVFDELLIESTHFALSEWGEIMASKTNSKHVIIDLQEQHSFPDDILCFYLWKYNHFSLYGIAKNSINSIFGEKWDISIREDSYIEADCINVTSEGESFRIDSCDYNIGCIGRLEKKYVLDGVKAVVRFAAAHKSETVCLLIIGGSADPDIKCEIERIVKSSSNISLNMTGYLYPIPQSLLHKMDCVFSSAGSALVSLQSGIPTISMAVDGSPIGILNYTTKSFIYKHNDNEENYPMEHYLEMILIDGFCSNNPTLGMEREFIDFEKEFFRQIAFFDKIDPGCHYDILNKISYSNKKDFIYYLIGHLFGGKSLEKIQWAFFHFKQRIHHSLNQ